MGFQLLRGVAVVAGLLILAGCGHAGCPGSGTGLGSTCGQTSTTDSSSTTTTDTNATVTTNGGTGQLYVDSTIGNISHFSGATALTGLVVPSAVVSGSVTQLTSPGRLLLDSTNDTLYVANAGNSSVAVYSPISTSNGNTAPVRVLGGTGSQLSAPTALALDSTRNVLYVANGNQSVIAVPSASTATGVVAPARTIAGGNTGFTAISSLVYDSNNDVLYVVDSGANSVLVFATASNATGNIFPGRKITGTSTQLNGPQDAILDGTRMYISNAGSNSILRFENVTTINGNLAPTAVLSGSATQLSAPGQMALHSGFDELYVDNVGNNSVLVFTGISTASGSPFPSRVVSSNSLTSTSGLAVDFTR